MEFELAYPAKAVPDDGAYSVTFRDFPEAFTYGNTLDEALAMAVDCLGTATAGRMRDHEDMPKPSRPKRGEALVHLRTLTAAKALLYQELRRQGLSLAELGRRLGWDYRQTRRLLDMAHHSRLDQLDAAFAALGKRLAVRVEDAA